MKILHRRRGALWFAVVLVFCSVKPPWALGAQQPPPPPSGRRSSPTTRPSSATQPTRGETVNQRAQDLEMLSTVGRRAGGAESVNTRLANQFITDFDRLIQVDTDTIAPLSTAAALDYKLLSQATGEVTQRAKRIKLAVALPLDDKKTEKVRYEADAEKLQSMLAELDRVMKSFLGNPVFRVNSPNDSELRSAAGRDLDAIIKLSDVINKMVKSLSKTPRSGK